MSGCLVVSSTIIRWGTIFIEASECLLVCLPADAWGGGAGRAAVRKVLQPELVPRAVNPVNKHVSWSAKEEIRELPMTDDDRKARITTDEGHLAHEVEGHETPEMKRHR